MLNMEHLEECNALVILIFKLFFFLLETLMFSTFDLDYILELLHDSNLFVEKFNQFEKNGSKGPISYIHMCKVNPYGQNHMARNYDEPLYSYSQNSGFHDPNVNQFF